MTGDINPSALLGDLQQKCLVVLLEGDRDWYNASEVAEEIESTSRRNSESLAKLADRGILERRIDPLNPVAYRYRLTDAGRDALVVCDYCDEPHLSAGRALECCSEQFDDAIETNGAATTVSGPTPASPTAGDLGGQR